MKLGIQEMVILLFYLLIPIVCGLISRAITKSRGMNGGFWWGFFLLVIGIVVVAVRPNEKPVASPSASRSVDGNYSYKVSSAPEELKKYKELLDSGAITQEEFDAKKKQLLGL